MVQGIRALHPSHEHSITSYSSSSAMSCSKSLWRLKLASFKLKLLEGFNWATSLGFSVTIWHHYLLITHAIFHFVSENKLGCSFINSELLWSSLPQSDRLRFNVFNVITVILFLILKLSGGHVLFYWWHTHLLKNGVKYNDRFSHTENRTIYERKCTKWLLF